MLQCSLPGDYNEVYYFLLIPLTCVLATAVILAVKYLLTGMGIASPVSIVLLPSTVGERSPVMAAIAESVALILLPNTCE